MKSESPGRVCPASLRYHQQLGAELDDSLTGVLLAADAMVAAQAPELRLELLGELRRHLRRSASLGRIASWMPPPSLQGGRTDLVPLLTSALHGARRTLLLTACPATAVVALPAAPLSCLIQRLIQVLSAPTAGRSPELRVHLAAGDWVLAAETRRDRLVSESLEGLLWWAGRLGARAGAASAGKSLLRTWVAMPRAATKAPRSSR